MHCNEITSCTNCLYAQQSPCVWCESENSCMDRNSLNVTICDDSKTAFQQCSSSCTSLSESSCLSSERCDCIFCDLLNLCYYYNGSVVGVPTCYTNFSSAYSCKSKSALGGAAIAGIVIGAIIAALLFGLVGYVGYRKYKGLPAFRDYAYEPL